MQHETTAPENLGEELSDKEIKHYEDVCDQLCRKYSVSKVHPFVFIVEGSLERVVCYLKEPFYEVKVKIMDKAAQVGLYSAADELRRSCVLREDSDPRTYGDGHECDKFKLGVTDSAVALVSRMENMFKKKSSILK